MNHIFILHPDINLLEEYRYWDISLPTTSPVHLEVGTINTDKERKSVEDNFRELLEEYQIPEHYETLLTICLSLLNWLSEKKEAAYETFQYKHKVKQTASLFQYFKAKDGKVDVIRSLPQSIKITFNSNDFIKIDNAELVFMMMKPLFDLYNQMGGKGFIPHAPEDNFPAFNIKNIDPLYKTSPKNPYRITNRLIAVFILYLMDYLNDQTIIKKIANATYSNHQLKFIYDVLDVLELIKDKKKNATKEQTLKSILKNHIQFNN